MCRLLIALLQPNGMFFRSSRGGLVAEDYKFDR